MDANGKNADGNVPAGTLIENASGVFFGTAFRGGTSAAGTVYTMVFPPVITSATTAAATVGKAFSYQITASGNPTSYGVQGLPAGLTVNGTTGLVSGTPRGAGTYNLTLNAYNAAGKGSATLKLTVALGPPTITGATTASGTVGTAFSYQITATAPCRPRQGAFHHPAPGQKHEALLGLGPANHLEGNARLGGDRFCRRAVVSSVHVGNLSALTGGRLHVGKQLVNVGTLVLVGCRDVCGQPTPENAGHLLTRSLTSRSPFPFAIFSSS